MSHRKYCSTPFRITWDFPQNFLVSQTKLRKLFLWPHIDQDQDKAGPDLEENLEENCLDSVVLSSLDVSQISSHPRLESNIIDSGQVLNLDSDWRSSGAMQVNPEQSLVPNMVYSLPENLSMNSPLDRRVLNKAQ